MRATHPRLSQTDIDTNIADIDAGEAWLRGREGYRPWFRYPFLDEGQHITTLWLVNRVVDLIFVTDMLIERTRDSNQRPLPTRALKGRTYGSRRRRSAS